MVLGEVSQTEHIATGGTVDGVWSPEKDTVVMGHKSSVADHLQFLGRHGYPIIPSEVLMLKDSRDITSVDKNNIARRVAESATPMTIVSSGTYLMKEIGDRIRTHPNMRNNRFNKRVAMFASLTPMNGFSMSDGGFSLGMACAILEHKGLVHPVVGVVNGMVAPINALEKDLTTATFENIDKSDSVLGYNRYTLVPAGGSIDFVFDGLDGVRPAATSSIPRYLRDQVRTVAEFDATPPILKDSRNLTDAEQDLVVDLVREAPTEFVLVTSGLLEIAALRKKLAAGLRKGDDRERRVIVTGSRYLLRSLDESDAPFNLGYAHGKMGIVEPGVHVTVAGRLLEEQQDPLEYCYTNRELEDLGYRVREEQQP